MSGAWIQSMIDDLGILATTGTDVSEVVLIVDPPSQTFDSGQQGGKEIFGSHFSEAIVVEVIFFAGREAITSLGSKGRPGFSQSKHRFTMFANGSVFLQPTKSIFRVNKERTEFIEIQT